MRHASLFSGIGGFDLAAEWMGWENVFHCDINPFGKKVLEYYYPKSISYDDITKTDFSIHRGDIDILTGGFPCQPYSLAGKRKGKEDERHLWPEMLRAISEIQPRWVIGENVYGLVNWDGGLVFNEVQSDLEAQGYEVFPYVLPAASINAPHRRDRVFFVAYSNRNRLRQEYEFCTGRNVPQKCINEFGDATDTNCDGFNKCDCEYEINPSEGRINAFGDISEGNGNGNVTDTNGIRRRENEWRENGESNVINKISKTRDATDTESERFESFETRSAEFQSSERQRLYGRGSIRQSGRWENFPTQSPICDGNDGFSDRLDSITFSKWRNESIKAGGNAVVPQLIYVLFKTIIKFEKLNTNARNNAEPNGRDR